MRAKNFCKVVSEPCTIYYYNITTPESIKGGGGRHKKFCKGGGEIENTRNIDKLFIRQNIKI